MAKRKPRPRLGILHRDFEYVPSHCTNLAATFARERARLDAERRAKGASTIVTPIIRKAKA